MPEALLFQTGYLTIRRIEQRGGEIYYRLGDAAKYRGRGAAIYLIGVEFSRETRNVAAFAVERV